jgi:hypothetical protein
MEIRNENLRVAMKSYVAAAIEYVADRAKEASDDADDFDFY